jgi:hypothetical protein
MILDIYNPLDPRFDESAKEPGADSNTISVPCHDDDGNFITQKDITFEYYLGGLGFVVTVHGAGIFKDDCIVAIGDHLKTRVQQWVWI